MEALTMNASTRRPILAGNWKMHLDLAGGLTLATEVRNRCGRLRNVDVVLSPVAAQLHPIAQRLDGSAIGLAAQNCHHSARGAFTGELSPTQVKDIGATYVILGHSERRQFFGETDEGVSRKARAALDAGLVPILCIGETLAEREAGRTLEVVRRQLDAAVSEVNPAEAPTVVLAYEPVWAIGTGRTATPAQAQEVHAAIRARLAERFGAEVAGRMRLQYGGSVKADNIVALMSEADIDGALIGGASLDADSFISIVTQTAELAQSRSS
jgi:triosephosphate isomerase